MTSLTHRLETAQKALIGALDAQDAEAIQFAIVALTPLVEELQHSSAIYADAETKQSFEKLGKLADAAIYRVNILHDQTRRRLEMLHDQRGKTAQTYARPVARVIEA